MPSHEFKTDSMPSLISADLMIDGNLTCEGAIQIDGKVNGDINSNSLTIGECAEVDGVVTADDVTVHGNMQGEIRSHSVQVMSTARITGDIVHQILAVEAGASIEGQMRRMDSQSAAQVQALQPAKAAMKVQQPAKAAMKAKVAPNGASDGDDATTV